MSARGTSLSRRQALAGGLMLATAGAAAAFTPRTRIDLFGATKLSQIIPAAIGPWRFHSQSGLVVPPEDQLADKLYDQLLTRVYLRGPEDPPIMLLIAQSPAQDGVIQVHRPEVCYPASGFALGEDRTVEVPRPDAAPFPARAFAAQGAERVEQLMYWTRVGDELPMSWAAQRMAVVRANLRGQVPDGVLVRISTLSPDRAWADRFMLDFAGALLAAVPAKAARALAGGIVA